ncbi:MAG: Crp/Fnr family transcriptional regulator [Thermoleophilia bacterium]
MKPPVADLSIESTLQHCELLEPLSERQIAALAACAAVRTLREGEALFGQDQAAHDLFVVESGRLAVRLATPAGHVIEVFGAGQYRLSGWSALVAPHAYIADGRAIEDCTVIVIPAAAAEEIFLREPAAAYQVMKQIAGTISVRLRDIKEELIEVLGG